jgi:ParB family chromosome partitioning protein
MEVDASLRRRQALGRGLGALIPGADSRRELLSIPVEDILPATGQPRAALNPSSLEALAQSIRESGVLQPILVKRDGTRYRLIAGERRWRAAQLAGLTALPALVKDVDDREGFALALVENLQREDLTPLEEALAYRRLLEEYGYTQEALAQKLGKGRSTIANTLRLLDLPEEVQQQVHGGELSAGHARAVLSLPASQQADFARELVARGASVRQAETAARPQSERSQSPPGKTRQSRLPDERRANLAHIERRLCETLDTRVVLSDRGGRGKIEIFYDDDDKLQELIERLLERPH